MYTCVEIVTASIELACGVQYCTIVSTALLFILSSYCYDDVYVLRLMMLMLLYTLQATARVASSTAQTPNVRLVVLTTEPLLTLVLSAIMYKAATPWQVSCAVCYACVDGSVCCA
jgi:hypothetical protein